MERADLARILGGRPGRVVARPDAATVVAAATEAEYQRAFAEAVSGEGVVLLSGADWQEDERRQLEHLAAANSVNPADADGCGWLGIPTGGTGGRLRFARHDEKTLAAAVRGFGEHFGVSRVNAAGVLPLHHVSGLLAWMRCALTGGEYRGLDWKEIEAGELPTLPTRKEGWFFSVVPTQLGRLLRRPAAVDWLRRFRAVFVGGGPAWPELLERAAAAGIPAAPSYGMTETAAMIAALKPEEFLAGGRSSGRVLPHARVAIGADGRIRVTGDSLFRGYFPEWRSGDWHDTADAGRLDEMGHLHVEGRADGAMISGGEKVDPLEVEAALRETGEFDAVAVVGVADPEWGQLVVAAYASGETPDLERVRAAISTRLAPAKRPKRYVALASWPAAGPGKINRVALAERVAAAIRSGTEASGN